MVSYEAVLGLTVVTVVLVTGSLRTSAIVASQHGGFLYHWNIIRTGVVPFVIFLIAITAEMTRPPFDLVEAEEELSGGYNVEYSSIDFALFYLAEYADAGHQLGHHRHPVVRRSRRARASPGTASGRSGSPSRCFIILFIYVWVRATLPRLRYDQLMDLGLEAAHPGVARLAADRRRVPDQRPLVGTCSPGRGCVVLGGGLLWRAMAVGPSGRRGRGREPSGRQRRR